ncbi:helix-turn-helix domain-containing protein [Sphingobium yanoikuyae]|uniref:helix-turn-helix domain-containing protein n=1 Tax=Sphingobium yanoikuyae TaxID=13690 RepID=UPI0035B3FEC5
MPIETAAVPIEDSALRAWRKSRSLTLVEAADLVPTTHSVWLRWESGERDPNGGSLRRLSEVTGLTTDQILRLTPHNIEPHGAGSQPQDPAGVSLAEEDAARASSASFPKG